MLLLSFFLAIAPRLVSRRLPSAAIWGRDGATDRIYFP